MINNIKYDDYGITFAELPDEVSLIINLTNCPHRCLGCHSPQLREDIGTPIAAVYGLIEQYHLMITAVCFMGGDAYHQQLSEIITRCRTMFPDLKYGVYSGDDEEDPILQQVLDYYKTGSWQQAKGPLNASSTNQRLYHKVNGIWQDITAVMQERHKND